MTTYDISKNAQNDETHHAVSDMEFNFVELPAGETPAQEDFAENTLYERSAGHATSNVLPFRAKKTTAASMPGLYEPALTPAPLEGDWAAPRHYESAHTPKKTTAENVISLFPGQFQPSAEQWTRWMDPLFLEKENESVAMRRTRAIDRLKQRFQFNPTKMKALQQVESFNTLLLSDLMDMNKAEMLYHQKTDTVVNTGLPSAYLRVDNITWAIQSLNSMVLTMSHWGGQNQGPLGTLSVEQIQGFQELKIKLYQDLDAAEADLKTFCQTPPLTVESLIWRILCTLKSMTDTMLGRRTR